MKNMEDITNIVISRETANKLIARKKIGMSYDDVIKELLEEATADKAQEDAYSKLRAATDYAASESQDKKLESD